MTEYILYINGLVYGTYKHLDELIKDLKKQYYRNADVKVIKKCNGVIVDNY